MTIHDLSIEIGGLAGLDLSSLRDRWRTLYGTELPVRVSRELLIRAIAYRLQENAHGGLPGSVRRKLVAAGAGEGPGRSREIVTIKPGTRFLREWQGRTHEVTVTPGGRFVYAGAEYSSLSAIARLITGTRWSGPAFFGIKSSPDKR